MGVFNSLNETSEKALDIGEVYYKKTQEYYKLKIFQQLTLTIGTFCKIAIIGSLLLLALIFFSVSATIALAQTLDNPVLACSVVGLSLCALAVIAYLLRTKIDTAVITKTAKSFF